MNAYSPLASMKRLEEAGLARAHAEAIASEIAHSRQRRIENDCTSKRLGAAFDKQAVHLSIILAAQLIMSATIIGVLMSIFAAH